MYKLARFRFMRCKAMEGVTQIDKSGSVEAGNAGTN